MRILFRAIARAVPFIPGPIVRRVAGRYIAGETMDDALHAVATLHAAGLLTTVDLLGENLESESAVRGVTEEYLRLLDRLAASGFNSSQASVKPTLVGLRLGEELALEELEKIVRRAARHGMSVCIDMEDSATTEATLRLYRSLRQNHENVWVAIQACLRRSRDDVAALLPLQPWVRVCKGIYEEPPAIALKDRQEIRRSFLDLVRLLVKGGGHPAIATHDGWLLGRCFELLDAERLAPSAYEVEMLLGVGEVLRPRVRERGSALRIYCPYGGEWEAYARRRLRENPQMVGPIIKQLLLGPFHR